MAHTLATLALSGILQPQMQNQFRIRFVDQSDNTIEDTEVLTMQLVLIDSIPVHPASMSHAGLTSLTIQQDIDGTAVAALYNLMEDQPRCDVLIEYLNGDDHITHSQRLIDVCVFSFNLSALGYKLNTPATVDIELAYTGSALTF